jgi:hypothetical protein
LPETLPLHPVADAIDAVRDRADADRPTSLAAVEPLLVDTEQVVAVCGGISVASWHRLKAAGKTPAPVRLGGRVLYRIADLRLWVAWNCPDRRTFEARKAAERPR